MSYASFKTRYVDDASTYEEIEHFLDIGTTVRKANIPVNGGISNAIIGKGNDVLSTSAKGSIGNAIIGKGNDVLSISAKDSIGNAIVGKGNDVLSTSAKGIIGNASLAKSQDMNMVKMAVDNMTKLPVNARNINNLSQIFMNNISTYQIAGGISSSDASKDVNISNINIVSDTNNSISSQYVRMGIRNYIANTIKLSNINIQASVVHCEFDNVALSGQYTVELNLIKSQGYHPDYLGIINTVIPPAVRMGWANRQNFDVTLDFESYSLDKIIVIDNSTFNKLTLLNPNKLPIIFVNCQGRVNIVYKTNPSILNFLRSSVCPACPTSPACPPAPKQTCPTCPTCPACPPAPKHTCPACPVPPKHTCPVPPKHTCPVPPKHTCPPARKCPVCLDDEDEDDY